MRAADKEARRRPGKATPRSAENSTRETTGTFGNAFWIHLVEIYGVIWGVAQPFCKSLIIVYTYMSHIYILLQWAAQDHHANFYRGVPSLIFL